MINNELTEALLSVLQDEHETEDLRAQAALSLGPVLEQADLFEFNDPDDFLSPRICSVKSRNRFPLEDLRF